jgi:hypothetical protein
VIEPVKSADEIIEEELTDLEHKLRQLKVRYDQFFYGNQKLPPTMLRSQVDRLVRKYANVSMRGFAHRYRFNNLLFRYQSFSELWSRKMRTQEEGDRPSVAARTQPQVVEKLVARTRIADPKSNPDQLREIYDKFVESRKRNGQKKKPVSFDKFVRGIAGQAAQLRKSSGCAEIELRLVIKNDQVQLKARPGN